MAKYWGEEVRQTGEKTTEKWADITNAYIRKCAKCGMLVDGDTEECPLCKLRKEMLEKVEGAMAYTRSMTISDM